jgi:cytochrome c553
MSMNAVNYGASEQDIRALANHLASPIRLAR